MADQDDDGPPQVPIVCTECGTETRIPLPEVADTLERHNDQLHGGDEVAQVDPALRDQLTDLVVEDLGLLDDA